MQAKIKYQLEYPINSSPKILFSMLSTPGGLAEWFADDVNIDGKVFTFIWDNSEQRAELIQMKENKYVRFRWLDEAQKEPKTYFEFKIEIHELTNDVALIITDFANPDEKKEAVALWDSQVANLKRILGL